MLVRFHGAAEPALEYSLKYALRYINHVPTRTMLASENVYNYMLLRFTVLPSWRWCCYDSPWQWCHYDSPCQWYCYDSHACVQLRMLTCT